MGFSDVREWGGSVFETAVSTKDISFVEIREDGGSQLYAGLLYYDMADLWVDIYSYSGVKGRSPPGMRTYGTIQESWTVWTASCGWIPQP